MPGPPSLKYTVLLDDEGTRHSIELEARTAELAGKAALQILRRAKIIRISEHRDLKGYCAKCGCMILDQEPRYRRGQLRCYGCC